MDIAGGLWPILTVAGVAVLAGVLIYAMMTWRRRRKDAATRRERDQSTREVYRSGG